MVRDRARGLRCAVIAISLVLLAPCWAGARAQAAPLRPSSSDHPAPRIQVDLQSRVKDIEVVEIDGVVYVRPNADADPVRGDEWLRALHATEAHQREHGFLYVLFNITTPWSLAWILVGFLGQALFTLRMVVQWLASEKERRSVIPVAFWWGSLFGGILLCAYFVWRKDIVGIVGQSTGIVVYMRNLILIHRAHRDLKNGRTWSATSSPPHSPTRTVPSTSGM